MFLLNVLLALAWVVLTGEFTPVSFGVGFVLAFLLLGLTERVISPSNYFARASRIVTFVLFFLWELLLATLRVAYMVLSPRMTLRPAVVAIPLDVQSASEIVLLANLITLTPGTLSLDTSADRRTLYVHALHVEDVETFRREIKEGFERRVKEVFQ